MKDAQGHGSDPRGVSGGNVSPQDAARAMHSDHVVGGANDSTYHGPHSHAAYAAEGIGNNSITKTSTTFYGDNGQTVHRVHWGNGSITESPKMGMHMKALFGRARREGSPHESR